MLNDKIQLLSIKYSSSIKKITSWKLVICIFLICIIGITPSWSQINSLKVKQFKLELNDLKARTKPRRDNNGDTCALIKIQVVDDKPIFKGLVVGDVIKENNTYMVYMAKGSKKLQIGLSNNLPIDIFFQKESKGEIPYLQSRATYSLILSNIHISSVEKITIDNVSFNMIRVDSASFVMGKNAFQKTRNIDELPEHKVKLNTFYIGETEVTKALWKAVMGTNPSYFKGSAEKPVERVSWNDCNIFIKRLNEMTNFEYKFRLPTEAEWEFASRGGNKSVETKYSGSNTSVDVSWNHRNCNSTQEVKKKRANALGIYDMSGNVWEWCSDRYGKYEQCEQENPKGPETGEYKVIRGGSWIDSEENCCTTKRYSCKPNEYANSLGFRLAF